MRPGFLMMLIFLVLTLIQEPISPVPVQWAFKTGQEFFVVEYQRQLIQVSEPVNTSSYFESTYLWRYNILSATSSRIALKATLERVIVNNPNESGGRAAVVMKNLEGTQSDWILVADQQRWNYQQEGSAPGKHAPPWFLTLGTRDWGQSPTGWKQQWEMNIPALGQAQIQLHCLLKQQTQDRVIISNSTRLGFQNTADTKVQLISSSSSPQGMGEYDFVRKCWQFFDFRFTGTWTMQQNEKTAKVKQDYVGSYRWYDRRPLMR